MKTSDIQSKMEARLKELQTEYKKGQEQLAALEQETNKVQSAMLRIGGAIQILQELLEQEHTKQSNGELAKMLNE